MRRYCSLNTSQEEGGWYRQQSGVRKTEILFEYLKHIML